MLVDRTLPIRVIVVAALAGMVFGLQTRTGDATFPGPNGKIVFKSGNDQIWIANADGTGATRLTDGIPNEAILGGDEEPAFSPFGDKIVYTSVAGGNQEIWTMDANGTNKRKLTTSGGPLPAGTEGCGTPDFGCTEVLFSENPSWSPDGRRIIFTSRRALADIEDLWVMNADGSEQHLFFASPNPAIADSEAQFSPDGTLIVFHKDGDAMCGGEMWLMNADASNAHLVLSNKGTGDTCFFDENYSWSPDGQRIAFTSDRSGRDEIWVIGRDGQGLVKLTNNLPGDGSEHPSYSPDGSQILFASDDQLWIMNANGSSPHALNLPGLNANGEPNWGRVSVRSFRAFGPMVSRD